MSDKMNTDNPFGSLEEARMRILGQWELEGKLDEPWTEDLILGLHREIMKYRPDTAAAVFPWTNAGSTP